MTTGNKRHSPCCPPPLCAYCVPDWPSSLSLTATEAPGWTQEPQEELARGVLANWEEGPVAPLRSFKDLWVGQTTEEGHFWRSGLCGPGRCGVGVRGLGRAMSTSLDTPHSPNPWYPRGQHLTNVRYHRDPAKTLWASQHQGFLEWQCSRARTLRPDSWVPVLTLNPSSEMQQGAPALDAAGLFLQKGANKGSSLAACCQDEWTHLELYHGTVLGAQ